MTVQRKVATAVKKSREENVLLPKRPDATKRMYKKESVGSGKAQPGQTAPQGPTHERKGSQPEREKHLYPSSTVPHQGAARSNKDPKAVSGKQKKRTEK